jgi:DNA repair protein SbcD/Mre11
MIRMLHLADLHIGVENYGHIDPETGLHTRLLDYLDRLDEALALGLDAGVDLVLIAGDIYKNRTPNPTHQREFARRIHRLRSAGIEVFILTGNHDISPAAGKAHSVEIFDALGVEGVTIADRLKLHTLRTPSGPVQIVAVPWVTRHTLLTKDSMRQTSFNEIEGELRRRLDRFITETADKLDPAIPAVLAFHGTVDGATLGSERAITLGQDLALPRSTLGQPAFDYVALGHIHKHQVIGALPPLVYPGSIERVDFGEENEDKGCVLVELERGATSWQFHKLNARPFVTIDLNLTGVSDAQERIAIAIGRHDLRQAVVRLELQATREQRDQLNEEQLRQQLRDAGAFVIAAININVERTARRRIAGAEELLDGLTPRKALELYLKNKQPPLSAERIATLLAAADELMKETAP